MTIDAQTRLLGLIGDPVAHSLSPALQGLLIERLGLNYRYLAFRVRPEDLAPAVEGLRALGAVGFNVTVPHKEAIIPLLDALSDEAQALGAVNAVANRDGELIGHNTDWKGFLRPLQDRGIGLQSQAAVVLGAGGAAAAAGYALARAGAARITLANRTMERARALARRLRRLELLEVELVPWEARALRRALEAASLLVHATPVGMWPHTEGIPLDPSALHGALTVYDLVYNPLETRLLREAKRRGARTLGGLDMLIHQGLEALRLWTGAPVRVEISPLRAHLVGRLSR